MPETKGYIAVDLGAESGRVMLGRIDGHQLSLQECYRFPNGPIGENQTLRWNFEALFSEIKTGIAKAVAQGGAAIAGIGVDSWGVDFGLIGDDGQLLENPYHYRDALTNGILEKAFELLPKKTIYDITGIQFMQINSVYQLLAMRRGMSEALARAKHLIFMADLVAYHLSGEIFSEYSMASTSQLMNMHTGQWARELFEAFELPMAIMPRIVKPGTVVGKLKEDLAREFGCGSIPLVAAGSHDTAAAVAAVPAESGHWAFLSSGTWSLMGVEIPQAIINDKTFEYQFTNEGGVENTIRLLKNITGLWMVQECRRQWQREGVELSYAELAALAAEARPFVAHIDTAYPDFLAPGEMPEKINCYLKQTHQKPIEDKGQMIRTILESLAFAYRDVFEKLEDITGHSIEVLHIVGGGIKNELLCQFAADAVGRNVVAGPIEATASGNIIMQSKAVGQVKSLAQGREIVRNSYELKEYQPSQRKIWDQQYQKPRNT